MIPDARTAAAQVLIVGFPAGDPPPEVAGFGGAIVFKRNLPSAIEAWELVRALLAQRAGGGSEDPPPLVCLDQEGGRVARLGPPLVSLPPMRALGTIDDEALTERAGRVLGAQLHAIGFDMDFAPVLDVDTNPDNPVIGDRSFGPDADRVTRHGLAFARGLAASGVLPCGKHFPGHGDTDTDSHLALPRLAHARARLDEVELAPFRAARGALPAIMTAHVVFGAIDPSVPATLSRRVVTGLLREELGFDGVVVSDDLEMRAIVDHWGLPEAACLAIEAGCDALLVCSKLELAIEAREALAGRAARDASFAARLVEAAERFAAMRRAAPPAPAADRAALDRALDSAEVRAVEAEIARRLGEDRG